MNNENYNNDLNKLPEGLQTIQVLEEKVSVSKKIVETGKVTLTKKVHVEDEVVNIPVIEDEVNVERIAINQYVESAPAIRFEGEKTIIPILKEVLVVEK